MTTRRRKTEPAGDPVALLQRDVSSLQARRGLLHQQLVEHAALLRRMTVALEARNALLRGYISEHDAHADLDLRGECRCALCTVGKPALLEVFGFESPQEDETPAAQAGTTSAA